MRGLTGCSPTATGPGAIDVASARRRSTLLPKLVLVLLTVMIVRDIVVRCWSAGPRSGVTTRAR
jgi:hypothetical protein